MTGARRPLPRVPTLTLAAALAAAAAVAGVLQVHSVDVFWHLAAGRWMLDHGELPRADPFRFTSGGAPWVDHEWGFQLLAALGERLGGLDALIVGRAALLAGLALLLFAGLRRRGLDAPAAVLIALAAVLGLRTRLPLRPELATLLALAVLLLLLERLRSRSAGAAGAAGTAVAVLALVAVWANLHPGVLLAPVVIGAYLAGARVAGRAPGPGSPPSTGPVSPSAGEVAGPEPSVRFPAWLVIALPIAAAAAILLNPWGAAVYRVPGEIAASLTGLPAENPDWQPLWRTRPLGFGLALAALAGVLLVARRRGGRVDPALGLAFLALLALAVTGARHQGLAWIGWALLTGSTLASIPPERRPRLRPALAAAACVLAAAWCLLPPSLGPLAPERRAGFGIEPRRFPEGAVAELARWEPVGNLYNSAPFGGYLLWRLHPPRQVFYDTRNEVDPGLLRELAEARTGTGAWNALLDRYAIDGAVVRYERQLRPVLVPGPPGEPPRTEHRASSALLFPRDRFALVHWDDVSMLFLARTPERAGRLAAAEYRWVQPEDWRATLERAAADPEFARGVAGEIARKRSEDPGSRRALAFEQALRGVGGGN